MAPLGRLATFCERWFVSVSIHGVDEWDSRLTKALKAFSAVR